MFLQLTNGEPQVVDVAFAFAFARLAAQRSDGRFPASDLFLRLRQQFLHLAVPGSNLTGHLAGRNLRGCGSDALHLPVGFGPLVRVIREPPARFHRTARRRAQRGAQEWVFDQVRQCVFPLFAGTGQETIHAVLDDAFIGHDPAVDAGNAQPGVFEKFERALAAVE